MLTGVQARVKALCSKGYSTMRREKIGALLVQSTYPQKMIAKEYHKLLEKEL
jgi:hypothetical protein